MINVFVTADTVPTKALLANTASPTTNLVVATDAPPEPSSTVISVCVFAEKLDSATFTPDNSKESLVSMASSPSFIS